MNISKREYFAAQAMQALIAKSGCADTDGRWGVKMSEEEIIAVYKATARASKDYSDALIDELEK